MNSKSISVAALLIVVCTFSFGQEVQPKKFDSVKQTSPLMILKVENQVVVLDPLIDEVPDANSFKAEWIKSVNVLNGKDALEQYGQRGADGVIIILFKDYQVLPVSIKKRFNAVR